MNMKRRLAALEKISSLGRVDSVILFVRDTSGCAEPEELSTATFNGETIARQPNEMEEDFRQRVDIEFINPWKKSRKGKYPDVAIVVMQ